MFLIEGVVSKIVPYLFASPELQVQSEVGHWIVSCSGRKESSVTVQPASSSHL